MRIDEILSAREIEEASERRRRIMDSMFVPMEDMGLQHAGRWIVQDLIPEGYLGILAGTPKSGKTALASAIAISVATGTNFGGLPVRQGPVLWIAAEESFAERRALLLQSPLVSDSIPIFHCVQFLPIDDWDSLMIIQHWVNELKASLLVVDPLIGAHHPRSLDDSWNARKTLHQLKRVIACLGIGCILIHHAKGSRPTGPKNLVGGSDQLSAVASVTWMLDHRALGRGPDPDGKAGRIVTLKVLGRGASVNKTWHFLSDGPLNYQAVDPTDPHLDLGPSWNVSARQRIGQALGHRAMTAHELASQLQLDYALVANTLTRLRYRGIVKVVGQRHRERLYRRTDPEQANSDESAKVVSPLNEE